MVLEGGAIQTWMVMYTSRVMRLVNRKGNIILKSKPLLTAQNVKRVRPMTAVAVRIAACSTATPVDIIQNLQVIS
jgi:hypothetical protein